METNVLIALIGFGGVIIGAFVQFLFAKLNDKSRNIQQRRTEAYIDFINFICQMVVFQKNNQKTQEIEATAKLTDAKARIAIYGSPEVSSLVADFFRKHANLSTPESHSSYVSILSKMRSEALGGELPIPNESISQLTLGLDVK